MDIEIVCALHLGAVNFRAAYEKVNQPIREAETGSRHVWEQVRHQVLIL